MRTMLSISVLSVLLAALPALAEQREGTVDSADDAQVTVSGKTYPIERDTEVVDRGGAKVAARELRPGTPAELEIDDEGRLTTLRATLVR